MRPPACPLAGYSARGSPARLAGAHSNLISPTCPPNRARATLAAAVKMRAKPGPFRRVMGATTDCQHPPAAALVAAVKAGKSGALIGSCRGVRDVWCAINVCYWCAAFSRQTLIASGRANGRELIDQPSTWRRGARLNQAGAEV